MPHFPEELIELILEESRCTTSSYSEKSSYLSTIALLSHHWRMYANSFRFAEVYLGNNHYNSNEVRRIKQFGDLIASDVWTDDEDIGHNVQELTLLFDPILFFDMRLVNGHYVNAEGLALESIARVLRTVFRTPISPILTKNYYGRLGYQNLGYCFHFYSSFSGITCMEDMGDCKAGRDMIDAIETICTRPNLSSLIVEKLKFVPKKTCSSPYLQYLHISSVSFDVHYTGSELPKSGTVQQFKNLRKLSFNIDTDLADIVDFHAIAPPLLTELTVLFEKSFEIFFQGCMKF